MSRLRLACTLRPNGETVVILNKHYGAREVITMFLVCALPVHAWAVLIMLRVFPAWAMRMDRWDLAGSIAYTLTFALIESLVVFLCVMLIDMVLLFRWSRISFVVRGSILVFFASVWSVYLFLSDSTPHFWRRNDF